MIPASLRGLGRRFSEKPVERREGGSGGGAALLAAEKRPQASPSSSDCSGVTVPAVGRPCTATADAGACAAMPGRTRARRDARSASAGQRLDLRPRTRGMGAPDPERFASCRRPVTSRRRWSRVAERAPRGGGPATWTRFPGVWVAQARGRHGVHLRHQRGWHAGRSVLASRRSATGAPGVARDELGSSPSVLAGPCSFTAVARHPHRCVACAHRRDRTLTSVRRLRPTDEAWCSSRTARVT